MVVLGTKAANIIGDSSREQRHLEAQLMQQPREETIEFVAEAATALVRNFVEERFFLQDDWLSVVNREILEWDSQKMGFVQGLQCLQGRLQRIRAHRGREMDSIQIV